MDIQLRNELTRIRKEFIANKIKEMAVDPQMRAEIGVTKRVGSKTRTSRMRISTYTHRYHQIKNTLMQIAHTGGLNSAAGISFFQEARQLLKDMYKGIMELGQENASFRKTEFYFIQTSGDLFQRIDQIYELLFQQDNIENVIGESFEREAAALDYIFNATKNKNINDIIDQLKSQFTKSLIGSQQVKRNNITISDIFIQKRYDDIDIEKGEIKEKVHYTIQSSNGEVDISGYLSDKQGKVDYIFNENDSYRELHGSLKTWGADLTERNFGKTSLIAGLIRGSSIDAALSYGLVLGWYNPQGKLKPATGLVAFHQYAKACLFIDIISGISQQIGNFADTVVVNDRFSKKVRVVYIPNLIHKILDNLNYLDKYIVTDSDKNYESALNHISIYTKDQKIIASENYLNSLVSQMAEVKLKLSGGILRLVE